MKIKRAHGSVELEFLPHGGSYLHSIVVDEDYRDRGYGNHLLEVALNKARLPIYLLASGELGGDPERLVKWYGRYGFKKKCGSDVGYNYNMVRWE